MNRLLTIVVIWIAGLAACGTQQPRLATRTDPGLRSSNLSSQSGVTTRRVWAGPGVDFLGSPSPDGRLLSFADWSTGNLGVRDLMAGQSRALTNKRSWAESNSYAENSAFARDGRRIAYSWFNDSTSRYELRVIGTDGRNPRVLVATTDITYFGPPAWSPSDRQIAVGVEREAGTWQLVLVAAETGKLRALKSFDWRGVAKLGFSSDGRFLAYDFPPDEKSQEHEIHVIATDGSREARVTNDSAHDEVFGWAPDGRHLLFFSDREGTDGVWAVAMTDGRVSGEPILVRRDLWRTSPIGPSRSAFFYGVSTENRSLFVATVDLERAQTVVPPTEYLTRQIPFFGADWSPDGRSIAFGVVGVRSSRIGIRTLESDEVREIATPLDQRPHRVRWMPDGNSLVAEAPQRGQYGIFRIDLRSGRTERVISSDGGMVGKPEPSADGRTLYFRRNASEGGAPSLVARDLATGAERVVCQCPAMWLSVSHDGRSLAFTTAVNRASGRLVHTIQVVPTSGGPARLVYQSPDPSETLTIQDGLAWSRDGRYLLFVRGSNEPSGGEGHVLMVMPAEGGEPRRLFAAPTILGIRMHPDGRRILFTGGEFKGEVWAMENLPAALQTSPSK